jgi:hypothetical protein
MSWTPKTNRDIEGNVGGSNSARRIAEPLECWLGGTTLAGVGHRQDCMPPHLISGGHVRPARDIILLVLTQHKAQASDCRNLATSRRCRYAQKPHL